MGFRCTLRSSALTGGAYMSQPVLNATGGDDGLIRDDLVCVVVIASACCWYVSANQRKLVPLLLI